MIRLQGVQRQVTHNAFGLDVIRDAEDGTVALVFIAGDGSVADVYPLPEAQAEKLEAEIREKRTGIVPASDEGAVAAAVAHRLAHQNGSG